MKLLRRFWHRLRETLTGARHDGEFADEIEAHLQMQAEDNLRLGMSPEAARRAAALKFGSVESARGSWRDQRVLPVLESIPGDVRFAVRGLIREPGFAGVCVLTLALAIGASSAIFSVVNAALIRPLPYPDADRLVQVWETNPRANRWSDWASYPDFADWRRENRVFEAIAAFRYGRFRLTDGEYPEMLVGLRVSPELFSVLGVSPVLGRPFLRDEGNEGGGDVAILSHGLWQRTFDSDAAVVGTTILLDGRNHLVVGVLPPGFSFPANMQAGARVPDVWIPLRGDHARGSHNYRVIARLKPDRTVQHARTDMDRLAQVVAHVDQDAIYAEQPKITPGYFRTMGMRLMRGREFTRMDNRTSQAVAIVSEGLASTYWPGEDAIGKRLRLDDQQWRSVVGIVPDARHDGLERPARPTIYIPLAQYVRDQLTLLVRTDSDPASFIGATRGAVMDVNRNQPLFAIQTMEQTLSESVSLDRFLMILVSIFAGVAVVLATVGIYGVLAYFVSQRRQEIGTRMALGASRLQVVWLVVKQARTLHWRA